MSTDAQVAVAAAVIVRRGRVLLVRRRHPEGELVWQFPAGKVEPGETLAEAAIRETLEETTLAVTELRVLGERVHPATGRQMHYVACEEADGLAAIGDESEVAAVAWVRRDELAEYVPYGFYEPAQAYLDEVLADAETNDSDTERASSGPFLRAGRGSRHLDRTPTIEGSRAKSHPSMSTS